MSQPLDLIGIKDKISQPGCTTIALDTIPPIGGCLKVSSDTGSKEVKTALVEIGERMENVVGKLFSIHVNNSTKYMLNEILETCLFEELKESCSIDFKALNNNDALNTIYNNAVKRVDDWKYASGSVFTFLPYSLELQNQKPGKLLKSRPNKGRFVTYGFDANKLLLETWDLNGDKEKFGSYVNCILEKNDNESDIIFFFKHDAINKINIQAITKSKALDNNQTLFITVNGLKPNNWIARLDTHSDSKTTEIVRYDPTFNLQTVFYMNYSGDELKTITTNGAVFWSKE